MSYSGFEPEKPFELPFTIPAHPTLMEDLANKKLRMELTEESKKFWFNGQPGQGFVGLMEMPLATDKDPNLIKIHLVPAFNKNDGLSHVDKNGDEFVIEKKDHKGNIQQIPAHLISAQPRGAFTGDLHMNAARSLGLGHKGQQNGHMMGFGIWKAGAALRVIKEDMPYAAIIPNEYILTRKSDDTWSLDYVNDDLTVTIIDINTVNGLADSLKSLNNFDVEKLTAEERQETGVDKIIQSYHQEKNLQQAELGENEIKFAKNRSTSQNLNAVHYTQEYQLVFNAAVKNHQAHTLNLKREIPLPIFDQILKNTCNELGINELGDLTKSKAIPKGDSDGLQIHLKFYNYYCEGKGFLPALDYITVSSLGDSKKFLPETKDLLGAAWENFNTFFKDDLNNRMKQLVEYAQALPLTLAIAHGDKQTVGKLIQDYSINPNVPLDLYSRFGNLADQRELLPIEVAGIFKNYEMIVELVKNGANPDINLKDLGTPLSMAITKQDLDAVKVILAAGANTNMFVEGSTPLILAIKNNDLECVKLLLAAGANPNFMDIAHSDKPFPMELAIKQGNMELMLALIEHGANPSIDVQYVGTPLKVAAERGDIKSFQKLIDAGANINQVMYNRENVLFVAARENNIELIELLLKSGIETNQINMADQIPLQVCTSDEAKELIFSHDMAAQLPPTYPENAKNILSKIYLSVEPLVSAVARTSEEKFDPQIVGGMLGNLMTYDPETHGDVADYFNPILTELNNFLTEFKQYASTNTRLYDEEDIIKVDKALAKIAAVAKNLTPAAMNEVKSDVDNDQSHSLANSTTLLMKKLDVDPVTAREESKMEVKEPAEGKPAEEKPASTFADTESHTKEAANDEIMTSTPRSMRH